MGRKLSLLPFTTINKMYIKIQMNRLKVLYPRFNSQETAKHHREHRGVWPGSKKHKLEKPNQFLWKEQFKDSQCILCRKQKIEMDQEIREGEYKNEIDHVPTKDMSIIENVVTPPGIHYDLITGFVDVV